MQIDGDHIKAELKDGEGAQATGINGCSRGFLVGR